MASCLWLSIAAAAKGGSFTGIHNIYPADDNRPETLTWQAEVQWEVPNTTKLGQNFTLDMPYVLKFDDKETTLDLPADDVTYAHCDMFSEGNVVSWSQTKCETTDAANGKRTAKGSVRFKFRCNAG